MKAENREAAKGHRKGGGCARAAARVRTLPNGGPLDTITNNSATPSRTAFPASAVDRSTGEIVTAFDPTQKWRRQAAGKALVGGRFTVCMSTVRTDRHNVEVRTSEKSGRNYYAGLMACGSVWVCPVCAPKIQKVRADELRAAIAAARSQGLQVAMLTLTIPHTRFDDLAELLRGFTGALGALFSGRVWKKHIRPTHNVAGYVRALETTWGEANGWHPHAHVLIFLDEGADLAQVADTLFPSWETAVKNRGLGQVNRAAFTLQDGTHANRYIAKMGSEWGPAEELVLSHTKSASGPRYSPFDLLGEYTDGDHDAATRARFGRLFIEYAKAYKGRRQLQWSQGLKRELLGTDGMTDEEIAESIGEADAVLATLTLEDWYRVRRAGLRGTLLMVADHHGADGVRLLLRCLLDAEPPGQRVHAAEPQPLPER